MPLIASPITTAAAAWAARAFKPVRRRIPKKISRATADALQAITPETASQRRSQTMPGDISIAAMPV